MTAASEPANTSSSLSGRSGLGVVDPIDLRDRFGTVTSLHLEDWDYSAPGETLAPGSGVRGAERLRAITVLVMALLDVVILLGAMALAFRLRALLPGDTANAPPVPHTQLALVSLPIWVAFLSYYGLYSRQLISTRLDDFRRSAHAVGASVITTMAVAFVVQWSVARSFLLITFVVTLAGITLEREVARRAIQMSRRRGHLLNSLVIVGTNREGRRLSDQFIDQPELGYRVVGFVDAGIRPDLDAPSEQATGETVARVVDVVQRTGAGRVLVARTAVDVATTNRLTRTLTHAGIPVEITSSLDDIDAERLTVRPLGRFASVAVEPVRRGGWRAAAKRTFDILGSLVVLVLVSPILVVAAIAVKCTSPGPLLFSHDRVGLNGRWFKLFKIRSMVPGAEHMVIDLRDSNEADGPLFKIQDDPRVTPAGRILRSLSIDEIPQLWNVLRGEMSLVGPRPALPSEVEQWSPEVHQRLHVKPGVTGMWQVSGRSNASFEEYVRLDLYYVDNWSLWTDIAILAKTLPSVLLRRGAY